MSTPDSTSGEIGPLRTHWDGVYSATAAGEHSWHQQVPSTSLRLIRNAPGSLVDVGCGTSTLVDAIAAVRRDVTLVDTSSAALDTVRTRLATGAADVTFVVTDITQWTPRRTFDCWHDRAAFHFLVDPTDRSRYVDLVQQSVAPGGAAIIATFAGDGPTSCSGLPAHRYEPADLVATFGDAFTLEHSEHENHHTPGDAIQRFTWVVLRRR